MTDYKDRIQNRAKICGTRLDSFQLAFMNQIVNKRIVSGLHERDALDYAYFYIKRNY